MAGTCKTPCMHHARGSLAQNTRADGGAPGEGICILMKIAPQTITSVFEWKNPEMKDGRELSKCVSHGRVQRNAIGPLSSNPMGFAIEASWEGGDSVAGVGGAICSGPFLTRFCFQERSMKWYLWGQGSTKRPPGMRFRLNSCSCVYLESVGMDIGDNETP
jgi:hypothetical protein